MAFHQRRKRHFRALQRVGGNQFGIIKQVHLLSNVRTMDNPTAYFGKSLALGNGQNEANSLSLLTSAATGKRIGWHGRSYQLTDSDTVISLGTNTACYRQPTLTSIPAKIPSS